MIKYEVPVRTKNPLNGAQGRSMGAVYGQATRRKRERNTARLATLAAIHGQRWRIEPQTTVTLCRIAPRKLDAGCGLNASLKSVRDGIADALGVNDGSDAVSWIYAQRRGEPREYSVFVEIASAEQPREAMT